LLDLLGDGSALCNNMTQRKMVQSHQREREMIIWAPQRDLDESPSNQLCKQGKTLSKRFWRLTFMRWFPAKRGSFLRPRPIGAQCRYASASPIRYSWAGS
jgi:hypothetical protein